jgi:hypothetical protein
MGTRTGSGVSTLAQTSIATAEAVRMAMRNLDGARPLFGFVFISPKRRLSEALAAAREVGSGADFIGCTTAGEITERGLIHDGVVAMVVASDELLHRTAVVTDVKNKGDHAVRELCAEFDGLGTASRAKHYIDSTTVTLVDGLNGLGEGLINGLVKSTRKAHQVVGGAAGDEGAFKATQVGGGLVAGTDSTAALHVFSALPWGIGVDHGLRPSTAKMVVTRAERNVVYEIDGKPAFKVYQEYAQKKGVTLTPENAGSFLVNNEIGVYFLNQLQRARAPLSIGSDGSLNCAASIEQGASITILDGQKDELVNAATRAAEEAKAQLNGAPAAGVLLFDCICRGSILGGQFRREIDAIKSVFPDVPITGFLTYGEIARYKGRLDGWHNATAVVAAIPTR